MDVTITLSNGKKIKAFLNANTFESDVEINKEEFDGGLDKVSYQTEKGETINLGEVNLVYIGLQDGKWLFGLNPLTEQDKANKRIADLEDMIADIAGGAE